VDVLVVRILMDELLRISVLHESKRVAASASKEGKRKAVRRRLRAYARWVYESRRSHTEYISKGLTAVFDGPLFRRTPTREGLLFSRSTRHGCTRKVWIMRA
jgi:hypothetical protein